MPRDPDIPHEPSYEKRLAMRRKAIGGDVVPARPRRVRDERDENPTQEDVERFGDVTVTCKGCGKDIYDEAEICWNCGRAVLGADRAGAGGGRVPWWVILAAALALLGMLWVYVR
jgi:hypothetical protein